jgi:hypothetical protein
MMLAYWENAPEKHRQKLSSVMKSTWDDEKRAKWSRALKQFWKDVL